MLSNMTYAGSLWVPVSVLVCCLYMTNLQCIKLHVALMINMMSKKESFGEISPMCYVDESVMK